MSAGEESIRPNYAHRRRRHHPPSHLTDLWRNIRAGLPLALGRAVPAHLFRASGIQVVLLFATHLVLGFAWYFLLADEPRAFYSTAIAVHALWLLSVPLVAYVAWREVSRDEALLARATVALLSPLATGWVLYAGLVVFLDWKSDWRDAILGAGIWGLHFFLVWVALVFAKGLNVSLGLPRFRSRSFCALYAIGLLACFESLSSPMMWYTEWVEEPKAVDTAPKLDVERILYAQPERMENALAQLAPQRPGVVDLYLVAFGGDARQDVFRKEVAYVRELFDRRFDTEGRSLVLVNHRDTLDTAPIASITNLEAALEGVGRVIDPAEDILLVYMTSHGSRDHDVRVRFPRFPLNHVGPTDLRQMIDATGIEWPMVIVSACYSGGFLDAFDDDRMLVMTSAARDRTSFGCSDDADLTYFARAYFEHQLEETRDLTGAFSEAAALVSEWEADQGFTPSNPQLFVGAEMADRIETLVSRLDESAAPKVAHRAP